MSIISPADLEASPLADLHALASALGIDGFRRLRKEELAEAILARQGAGAPRRSRSASSRSTSSRAVTADPEPDDGDASPRDGAGGEPDSDAGAERPARSGRPRRRRGGRSREGGEESSAAPAGSSSRAREESEPAAERIAEGVVELLPNGSGFLRVRAEEVSDDDVYISAAQARRCELVGGDRISGPFARRGALSVTHP